ncbi:MAG: hypothetical protein AVDCRST_MAG64-4495, partial [uncultured Phycisphaerae bacterium]
ANEAADLRRPRRPPRRRAGHPAPADHRDDPQGAGRGGRPAVHRPPARAAPAERHPPGRHVPRVPRRDGPRPLRRRRPVRHGPGLQLRRREADGHRRGDRPGQAPARGPPRRRAVGHVRRLVHGHRLPGRPHGVPRPRPAGGARINDRPPQWQPVGHQQRRLPRRPARAVRQAEPDAGDGLHRLRRGPASDGRGRPHPGRPAVRPGRVVHRAGRRGPDDRVRGEPTVLRDRDAGVAGRGAGVLANRGRETRM